MVKSLRCKELLLLFKINKLHSQVAHQDYFMTKSLHSMRLRSNHWPFRSLHFKIRLLLVLQTQMTQPLSAIVSISNWSMLKMQSPINALPRSPTRLNLTLTLRSPSDLHKLRPALEPILNSAPEMQQKQLSLSLLLPIGGTVGATIPHTAYQTLTLLDMTSALILTTRTMLLLPLWQPIHTTQPMSNFSTVKWHALSKPSWFQASLCQQLGIVRELQLRLA